MRLTSQVVRVCPFLLLSPYIPACLIPALVSHRAGLLDWPAGWSSKIPPCARVISALMDKTARKLYCVALDWTLLMKTHFCTGKASGIVAGLLATILAWPVYSDSQLKVQKLGDELTAGEVESWNMLIDLSNNAHTIIQSSIDPLVRRSESSSSTDNESASEFGFVDEHKLNFLFECNPDELMHFSLRYPFDIQSGQLIRYQIKYGSELIEGDGEKLAELDKVGEESKQTYGLKDLQVIRITDNAKALASLMHTSQLGTLQITLLDAGQNFVTAEFDPGGFDRAFEFVCNNHPSYAQVYSQGAEISAGENK